VAVATSETVTRLLPLRADQYQPHDLHARERIWTETNCYVDVWIEVLHSLGLDPLAGAAFAVSTDFEGDQWTFFKYPAEDLRVVYGIEVAETNPWRPLLDHVIEHLESARLLTMEADSWFLPDTTGVSYGLAHVKSTIVPNLVDVAERRLGYFHNAGYFELEGADFDGIFRLGEYADPAALPPYVETVRLEAIKRVGDAELAELAWATLRFHADRIPGTNPLVRLGARISADVDTLRERDLDYFHLYAFANCRQCGASAELAADFLGWLADRAPRRAEPLLESAQHWHTIAENAKSLQFTLARAARGRTVEIDGTIDVMASAWTQATQALRKALG
jgi:hypothetical protein